MAPETQAVIARSCGDKRAYGARCARLLAQRRRGAGQQVSPYRCFYCGAWHIGHAPSFEGLQRIAEAIRDLHGNSQLSGRAISPPSAGSRGRIREADRASDRTTPEPDPRQSDG